MMLDHFLERMAPRPAPAMRPPRQCPCPECQPTVVDLLDTEPGVTILLTTG